MTLHLVANSGHSFRSDRVKRIVFYSLVTNAWAHSYLSLRNDLVTAFNCDFQIRAVTIAVQDYRLYNIQTRSIVTQKKRNPLLLIGSQSQLSVTCARVNAFDRVICRGKKGIDSRVADCQLKRCLSWHSLQTSRRHKLQRYTSVLGSGNGIDLPSGVLILLDYPTNGFRAAAIKFCVVKRSPN